MYNFAWLRFLVMFMEFLLFDINMPFGSLQAILIEAFQDAALKQEQEKAYSQNAVSPSLN